MISVGLGSWVETAEETVARKAEEERAARESQIDQMLNDDIRHELSVCVSLLVETMNLSHVHLMQLDLTIVSSSKDSFVRRVHRS